MLSLCARSYRAESTLYHEKILRRVLKVPIQRYIVTLIIHCNLASDESWCGYST